MTTGPIQRISRQHIEDRSDARLPSAWIGDTSRAPTCINGAWLTRGVSHPPHTGDRPVLLLLGPVSADARAELLAHATSGARVYALVGPEWSNDLEDALTLQARRVLIRRVPEVPISGVYADSTAQVWLGGGFVLRLDDAQAEALRQTFLRLFWHNATDEAWSNGQQFLWRPASERPFDVPESPATASVRWERPDARFTIEAPGAFMYLPSGHLPETPPRRLWSPAGPQHHDKLSKLVQMGVEVVWEDWGLPDLILAGKTGEALLPGTRGRLRLRLTEGQAIEMTRLLEGAAAWRFQTNIRLGDSIHRASKFWLPSSSAARGLEAEQLIKVPDHVRATSLRVVPDATPSSMPEAQPLALTVRYEWTVIPPRVPNGAEEDALISRWRKLDEDWNHRIARVRVVLLAVEVDNGRIRLAFPQLVSAMLGFTRTHSELLAHVTSLELRKLSDEGPISAPTMLMQLAAVEEQAKQLQTHIEEAERKAREDEERQRQQDTWQRRIDAANRDIPERRIELTAVEAQQVSIADALQTTKDDLESAEQEDRKDLKARKKKLSDDLDRANKKIKQLSGLITSLEQQAAQPFAFRPTQTTTGRPSQPGGRFVPPSSATPPAPQVPDEALPKVGSLRSQKNQRYLVIQTWEELAIGEQAASRLSAKLVAPESA